MDRIPVFQPHIAEDTYKHVKEALDVGWLGMGATTADLEERIASYLDLEDRSVIATNTGTAALHLALLAAGVGPGDEVITTSFNYVTDQQAILMCGAAVVMCDIDDRDLGMDPKKAEELITPRTRAILPLHFAGIPCRQKELYELADKHGLRVVEDGTHAFGTKIDGRAIGSFGDLCCFSFDPVKVMTSIDGGCIVATDESERLALQRYRLLGVDRDTIERYKNRRAWEYDVVSDGFRYHLNNISASVGVSQIKRMDEFINSRQAVCRQYSAAFENIDGLRVPASNFDDVSPFIYSLRIQDGRRMALIEHLQAKMIDTGIHFIPVHEHERFKDARCGDLSVTERVIKEVLTIPLHSNMRPEHVNRVIDGISEFFH